MEDKEKNQPEQPSEETPQQENREAEPSQPSESSPLTGETQGAPPFPPAHQPSHAPPVQPERRRSFVGPLILIFLGVVFLLNNLGLVGWSIWEILWRFWPVWLIAIGIDMLFGRRRWGGLMVLAILLTMLAGAFYYAGIWTGAPVFSYDSDRLVVKQPVSQALSGAREARVEIGSGVSRLDVRGGTETDLLIEGSVTPVPGERLDQDFSVNGSTAYYQLQSRFAGMNFPFGDRRGEGRWDLRLNEQIPMALTIQTGVGQSVIDLSRLTVTDLRVTSGVGETTLTLPAQGQVRGRVNTGVGQTTIRIPEGVAARIRVQTGIGGISVRGNFQQDGSYYTTPDYMAAVQRIDLEVEGGVGGIRIETTR